VSKRSILPVLRDLCGKEGIEFESDALERIAEQNDGDLRGAVNDLQAIADGLDHLTLDDVVTGSRDSTMGLFPFLDLVMKEAESARDALQSSYDVDETPDDLTAWIEENVPKVYDGVELARAYDHLANADKWLGRVRATQNYSYWRYAGDNMAAGVAAARDGTKGGWTSWNRPDFYHSSSNTAQHVVREIARHEGTSMATARREILPFLQAITHHCKPRDVTVAMAAAYDLEEEHVSFVTGSGETTNKVQSIVEDAAEMRAELVEEHAGGAFAGQADVQADSGAEAGGENGASDGDASDDGSDDGPMSLAELGDGGSGASGSAESNGRGAADGGGGGDAADGASGGDGEADAGTDAEDDEDQSGLTDFM
ncbi:MAG: replication factor C large subunit, partial [Halobaculum sp.]